MGQYAASSSPYMPFRILNHKHWSQCNQMSGWTWQALLLVCIDNVYALIGRFAWCSIGRNIWCLLWNTLHLCTHLILCCWCQFLHQVCSLQVINHLGRNQACCFLQSSWLYKLQFCLATWYTQNCSKWPCVLVTLEKVWWRNLCCYCSSASGCGAYTVQWSICQYYWKANPDCPVLTCQECFRCHR